MRRSIQKQKWRGLCQAFRLAGGGGGKETG
jgi:hypothetical protein